MPAPISSAWSQAPGCVPERLRELRGDLRAPGLGEVDSPLRVVRVGREVVVPGVDVANPLGAGVSSRWHGRGLYRPPPGVLLHARAAKRYLQADQPDGVPPLELTGERTLPDVPEENYWFRRHLAVYEWIAGPGGRACASPISPAVRATAPTSSPGRPPMSSGSTPTPRPTSTPRPATCGRTCASSAISSRTSPGPLDAVVFLQTIEHIEDVPALLGAIASAAPLAFISTPNRLTLAPEGAEKSDNPWHLREYTIGEYRERPRARLRLGRDLRALPRRQARGPRAGDRPRLGPRPLAAADHEAVLRPLHAGDQRLRLRAPQRRARPISTRRWTSWPSAGNDGDADSGRRTAGRGRQRSGRGVGDIAIVLHSHMPYVEGFGTYPFGEEWLFDAFARSHLPVLGGRPRPDDDDHPGARRPARGSGGGGADARVRPRVPGRLGRARRRRRRSGAGARLRGRGRALRARPRRARAARRRPARRLPGGRRVGAGRADDLDRHPRAAAADRDPRGPDAAARDGDPLAPPPLRPGAGHLAAGVRLRARASSTCSPSSGSSTSAPISRRTSPPRPRCARSRPSGHRAPSRSTGRPSSGCGRGEGYPSDPALRRLPRQVAAGLPALGDLRRAPTTRRRRPSAPASRPAASPATSPARLAAHRDASGRRGLLTFAIDTELLGHWWWEGPIWLEAALAELPAAGVRMLTARRCARPRTSRSAGRSPPSTWGEGKDRRTWDSPAGRRPRLGDARAPSCVVLREAVAGRLRGPALERAARELLALQSSDWAFLDYGRKTGDYPFQRALGHSRALFEAIECGASTEPTHAQPRTRPDAGAAARTLSHSHHLHVSRVLVLSWEYPPLIEGGLARHVRKLSEGLVELGVEVHVLTRGGEESPRSEVVGGVNVHRVLEPSRPRDLGEFVTWVERMNADMLAAGVELGDRYDFDLVHGHDWLVAAAVRPPRPPLRGAAGDDDPRDRARAPPGLGRQAPAVLHPRGRALDQQPLRPRHRLLLLHARADRRHLRGARGPDRRDPERDRPRRPAARRGVGARAPALRVRRLRTRSSSC